MGFGLLMVLQFKHQTKGDSCSITNPFCHNPERHRQRETFTLGRTLDIMQGHIFCLEGLMARL